MNPVKRKEISKATAEKLGKDFEQVDEIVAFYYRYVQKRLSAMENIAVNVPNLGTFVLKRRRVEKKMDRYTRFLETVDETQSIRAFETKQAVKKDIEKYQAALEIMDKEEERKQSIRTLRRNLDDADQDLERT